MARKQTIVEQLRAAIRKAEKRGITRYRIAMDAGIHQSQLTRLMDGDVSPRLDTAAKIMEAIGGKLAIVEHDA